MKSLRILFSILFVVLFVVGLAYDARSQWNIEADDAQIVIRVDTGQSAPYHLPTIGKYGYYDSSEVFHLVLDFSTPYKIVPPYSWSMVVWAPGSMDVPI
jgi:hypothetical protein